jgi:hypothetical protein
MALENVTIPVYDWRSRCEKKRFLVQLTLQLHVIPFNVNFNSQKYRTEVSQFSPSTLACMQPRIAFGINCTLYRISFDYTS